jgi:hypothetical protein
MNRCIRLKSGYQIREIIIQKQEIIKKNYIYTCLEQSFQLIQIQHNMNIKIRSIYTRHFYDKNKAEKGQKRPDSSC